jgi:hypothetical protein
MSAQSKRKPYLYLAIVCFIGIVAIFVIDGYLGIYDTIYITVDEQEMTVEPDYWLLHGYGAPEVYYMGADWGDRIFFQYELDNRRFSSYSTSIQGSLWKESVKILDLFSRDALIEPFDKSIVEWTLDSERLQSQGFEVGQYTLRMGYEGVERRIIVN